VPNYPNKYKSLILFSSVIPIHILNLPSNSNYSADQPEFCIISKALMEEQYEKEEVKGK